MEQDSKPGQKDQGRLAKLRKFIPTPEDAAIVKEMIADGLDDATILHALGHVNGLPSGAVLPNGHTLSNKKTTEQEEKEEASAAGLAQPGGMNGGPGVGDEDGNDAGENDVMTHVAGLLSHMTKKKPTKAR